MCHSKSKHHPRRSSPYAPGVVGHDAFGILVHYRTPCDPPIPDSCSPGHFALSARVLSQIHLVPLAFGTWRRGIHQTTIESNLTALSACLHQAAPDSSVRRTERSKFTILRADPERRICLHSRSPCCTPAAQTRSIILLTAALHCQRKTSVYAHYQVIAFVFWFDRQTRVLHYHRKHTTVRRPNAVEAGQGTRAWRL